MFKYPRTQHIQGSRLQNGDHDLEAVSWDELKGKNLVIEEKMDGANAGISFVDGKLMLQSRGHYLRGGPRERHFDRLKQWAAARQDELYFILGDRYVMYGEWLYAKHTCFYDALPHYFMEFDIYDTRENVFLSTPARKDLIKTSTVPEHVIVSVLVLAEGEFDKLEDITNLIVHSHFKNDVETWNNALKAAAKEAGAHDVVQHTDPSSKMEGLYIKWEEDGVVKGRYKFVRSSFTNSIMNQDEHWLNRPIVANKLQPGAEEKMFE